MKKISGKWKISLPKLKQLISSINQPVNFKLNNKDYTSLELIGGKEQLRCYKNIWTKTDSSNIVATIKVADNYTNVQSTAEWDFGYPIFYGASPLKQIDNDSAQALSKLITDSATFELADVFIPTDNYLYLCIPEEYDTGKLLININEVFGGISLIETKELAINDYIPKNYNIYRSSQTSLGKLHIVVSERSLGSCLYM